MIERSKLPPRRRSFEWALLGIALLILGTSISYWLYKERADIEAGESDRLQAQARVIDENLGHQLKGMDGALKGVLHDFPRLAVKNARLEAAQRLRYLKAGMTGVRSIFILDADGRLLAATWDKFIADQDFSHREYYRTPRERPDPAALYVSTPFTTIDGTYSLNVSRVATDPNGKFDGLVTATLDPDYFDVVLRSVLYAPDMATSIVHADGRQFVVQPENEQTLGKNLSMPNSNFSRYQELGQDQALMLGVTEATGEQHLRAYRTVKRAELNLDKPLVIIVDRSVSAMFASWRSDAFANGGFFVLFVVTMSMSLGLSQRRRHSNYAERRRTEEALRESEERYRILFNRASDGIMILSLSGKLVAVNESFARMHGYTTEEMQTLHLEDLDTPETFRSAPGILERILSGESVTFEVQHYHKDGHIVPLEVSSSLIDSDDGPLIQAFHRDIAERNRQRNLITEHNALLTHQKAELEATLGRIKRLEGLISICMCCKKIRTKDNAWQQIEQYLGENSEAVFSHALCPECYGRQNELVD